MRYPRAAVMTTTPSSSLVFFVIGMSHSSVAWGPRPAPASLSSACSPMQESTADRRRPVDTQPGYRATDSRCPLHPQPAQLPSGLLKSDPLDQEIRVQQYE